jgi:DNA-binding transcriptional regulator YiaG
MNGALKADEVRAIRERLGWPQTTLAERMSVDVRTVRRWESQGVDGPAAVLLEKLAEEEA